MGEIAKDKAKAADSVSDSKHAAAVAGKQEEDDSR
jgi:hypothetical protein